MSQKTNPTSLRLQKTNKHFSSSWYSDCFYSQIIANDSQTCLYIEGLSEQIGQSQMVSHIQRYYKRAYTYLFFLDTRGIRNQRESALRLSRSLLSSTTKAHQKHAASTAASTAFLHSCFDYQPDNVVEATSSVLLPTLSFSSAREKALLLPLMTHKQHHQPSPEVCAISHTSKASLCYTDGLKKEKKAPINSAFSKTRQLDETQSNKTQFLSRKAKTPYSYLWKDHLKQLPFFKFGIKETCFVQLAFNCSILRDLVVYNCNKSKREKALLSKHLIHKGNLATMSASPKQSEALLVSRVALATTVRAKQNFAVCLAHASPDIKNILRISCSANICYPLNKRSKGHSYPNLFKKSDKAFMYKTKPTESLQDAFVFYVPAVCSNPFHNLCTVGQINSKQHAVSSAQERTSKALLCSALNVFHGTAEAAFLLAYPSLNSLSKKRHQKYVSATDLMVKQCNSAELNCVNGVATNEMSQILFQKIASASPAFLASKVCQHLYMYMPAPLKPHTEHIRPYPYCISNSHWFASRLRSKRQFAQAKQSFARALLACDTSCSRYYGEKKGTTAHHSFAASTGATNMSLYPYSFLMKEKIERSVLTSIYPVRVVQDIQFAGFLAQEIAHLLQKGASFKLVQNRILSEHKKSEIIKGIRFSCSGRIGGRSKKAQKSKIQSVQWGETSLHVLSSKLSFASKSANTPFGKIGIKLWLCFH